MLKRGCLSTFSWLFKIVYQGLILPNLPTPLRYFNYISLVGQPRIPLCYNTHSITTSAIDTATVLVSNSQHSVGHLKTYSIRRQCQFDSALYQFDKTDLIQWQIPMIRLQRLDQKWAVILRFRFQKIYLMPLLCSGVFLTIGQHYVYVKVKFL